MMMLLPLRTFCLLITFIEFALAQTSTQSSSSSSSSHWNYDDNTNTMSLRRSLYESNPLGETELSDVWLCLACALGWTVWLLSSRKQAQVEPSIFDQKESIQVTGNVLEVTVGEDADGTGIPVYLALIDYVVECYDPDDDTAKFLIPQDQRKHPSSPPKEGKKSTEKFKKGVVLEHNSNSPTSPPNATDKHLQIRKCFYTNKLLDVGFANVKVLCLVEDPTTSELWDDYLHKKRSQRKMNNDASSQQNSNTTDMLQLYMVYGIAVVLIAASLYGGYRTVEHLPADLKDAGYFSLGSGALLLYPTALLLYSSYCFIQRWLTNHKGTIIHGSERWHCTRMACGIHPIMEEEAVDDNSSMITKNNNHYHSSSSIATNTKNQKLQTRPLSSMAEEEDDEHYNVQGLEMPKLHDPADAEYAPPKPIITKPPQQQQQQAAYPNAGCAMNEYNVQMGLQTNPSTLSSISSAGGKSNTTSTKNYDLSSSCQDASIHNLMEAFESMSAFGGGTSTTKTIDAFELKPKTTTTHISSHNNNNNNHHLRRTSSEGSTSRIVPTNLFGGRDHDDNDENILNESTETVQENQVTRIYSA